MACGFSTFILMSTSFRHHQNESVVEADHCTESNAMEVENNGDDDDLTNQKVTIEEGSHLAYVTFRRVLASLSAKIIEATTTENAFNTVCLLKGLGAISNNYHSEEESNLKMSKIKQDIMWKIVVEKITQVFVFIFKGVLCEATMGLFLAAEPKVKHCMLIA